MGHGRAGRLLAVAQGGVEYQDTVVVLGHRSVSLLLAFGAVGAEPPLSGRAGWHAQRRLRRRRSRRAEARVARICGVSIMNANIGPPGAVVNPQFEGTRPSSASEAIRSYLSFGGHGRSSHGGSKTKLETLRPSGSAPFPRPTA